SPVWRNSDDCRASSSAPAKSGMSRSGKTSVIENGRSGRCPCTASYRSGSSAACSSTLSCSGRSAYGQKRSSGRSFGCATVSIVLQNGQHDGTRAQDDHAETRTPARHRVARDAYDIASARGGAKLRDAERTVVRAERRLRHRQSDLERKLLSPRTADARVGR